MSNSSTLVIGSDGLLGSALLQHLSIMGCDVAGTTRRYGSGDKLHLDLADDPSRWDIPDHIDRAVICAGISDVTYCEEHPEITAEINVSRTVRLMERLIGQGVYVLFISTNRVFDGEVPRTPGGAAKRPATVYGCQKSDVEDYLLGNASKYSILRLEKVVSGPLKIVGTWLDLHRAGKAIQPFADYCFSPVALDTCIETMHCLLDNEVAGIYQLTSDDEITYSQLALRLAEHTPGLMIDPVSMRESGWYSVLYRKHSTLDSSDTKSLMKIGELSCESLVPEMLGITDG